MNSFHWLRAFLILLATCALVVAMSTTAFAQGCDKQCKHGKHRKPNYAELDANADGAVTAEEFQAFRAARMASRTAAGGKMKNAANAPSFDDLDLDGDGNLSADEFATHRATCPTKSRKDQTEKSG